MSDRLGEEFAGQVKAADLEASSRKFPYAMLLDADGNSQGVRIFLSDRGVWEPRDQLYDPEKHKGNLGCPCCLAPLKVIEGGYVEKGDHRKPADPYLKSESLADHIDRGCALGQPNKSAAKRLLSLMEYISAPGEKIIYWNFPYNDEIPEYYLGDHIGRSLRAPHATAKTQRQEETRGFKNLGEFLAVFRHVDPRDPVIDRIDVVAGNCRFPLREILAGNDWDGLSKLTDMREELGLIYPSVMTFELGSTEIEPVQIGKQYVFSSQTINGLYQNRYRVIAFTENPEVAEILNQEGSFALHGFALSSDVDDPILDDIRPEDDNADHTVFVKVNDPGDVLPISNPINAVVLKEPSYAQQDPEYYRELVMQLDRYDADGRDFTAE